MDEKKIINITTRTFNFGVKIIKLANKLPKTPANFRIGNQIAGSGTSVGANIEEAQHSDSKKDFVYKLNISLREARETLYWLKLIQETKILENFPKELINENEELIKILITIIKNTKRNYHLDS